MSIDRKKALEIKSAIDEIIMARKRIAGQMKDIEKHGIELCEINPWMQVHSGIEIMAEAFGCEITVSIYEDREYAYHRFFYEGIEFVELKGKE